jgi:sugar/nucleoside kinase (ribokinase family)
LGLLVVGSLALDSVETPFDKVDDALGGSATYISLAASYFSGPIQLVGVVGNDYPKEYLDLLVKHNVDLEGLQIIEGGKTFRWGGKYHHDLNVRDTLFTDLNVFENFDPVIPDKYKKSKYVCLGNIAPTLQLRVLDQMDNSQLVVCDTMNYWIEGMKDELVELLKRVNVLIINDSEARLLSNEPNLIKAAKLIREMGPEFLIIKKGEHGAMLFAEDTIFSAPAYPLYKTRDLSPENMKRAVIYGSAMASFCVEKFSTKALEDLSYLRIQDRFREFINLSSFGQPED